MVSSFTKGYSHLLEKDFFKLKGRDHNKLNFVDRLNLKGKLRHLIDVEFDEWETEIYNRCLKAETYEEVLDICGDIIDKLPKEKPQPPQDDPEQPFNPGQDSDEDEGDDDSTDFGQNAPEQHIDQPDPDSDPESQEGEEDAGGSEETSESSAEADEDGGGGDEEESVTSDGEEGSRDIDYSDAISETQRALDEELENLQEDLSGEIYVDAPSRQQINDCISTIDEVRKGRRDKLSLYNKLMTDSPRGSLLDEL